MYTCTKSKRLLTFLALLVVNALLVYLAFNALQLIKALLTFKQSLSEAAQGFVDLLNVTK